MSWLEVSRFHDTYPKSFLVTNTLSNSIITRLAQRPAVARAGRRLDPLVEQE